MLIRPAKPTDLPGIFAIYDECVLRSVCTFETAVKSDAEKAAWFEAHRPDRYPCVVADDDAGMVLGWAGLSAWSPRPAYARTAECSVYIHRDRRGCGVGRALMHDLMERTRRDTPVRVLIARIVLPAPASIGLHASLGFNPVGVLRRCGEKFGQTLDVQIMDAHLDLP